MTDQPDDETSNDRRKSTEDAANDIQPPIWTETHWLASNLGRKLILFDILLSVLIVAFLTLYEGLLSLIPFVDIATLVAGSEFRVTRVNIVLFTLLGALAYLFTPLYKDIDRSVEEVLEYNFRLAGAIPLAFGVFLFADLFLDNVQEASVSVLGINFLAGLFVNTFYKRLGVIADYFLPDDDSDS